MRKLIATVFNYSLDGLLADEGTDFWEFCFSLPENNEPDDPAQRSRTVGVPLVRGPLRRSPGGQGGRFVSLAGLSRSGKGRVVEHGEVPFSP